MVLVIKRDLKVKLTFFLPRGLHGKVAETFDGSDIYRITFNH